MINDIGHIDASFSARRPPVERSPRQDFAHELAKTGDSKIADGTSQQGSSHTADGALRKDNAKAADATPQQKGDAKAANTAPQQKDDAKPAEGMPQQGNLKAVDVAPKQDFFKTAWPTRTVAIAPEPHAGIPKGTNSSPTKPTGFIVDVSVHEQLSVAVQPIGNTEALLGSRVYGVHLLASAYLSELTTRGYPVADAIPGTTLSEMANMPSQTQMPLSDVSPASNETTGDAPLHEEALAVLSLPADGEATAATSAPSSSATSIASSEILTMLWPESSLRLTRQRDGSAAIWLRDYRLPSEGASHQVEMLVKGAQAAGIRLARIILNGREVWTSHNKNY